MKNPKQRTRLFNGSKNADGSRDYGTALVDAGIVAGFTFFSSLAGNMAAGSVSTAALSSAIAAGVAFFASLMISLGIKKPAT